MHPEYTLEEVRSLLTEHEALDYRAATAADVAEATDVLEGVEELVAKLDPAVRRETLEGVSIPVGDALWIAVANNCHRSAGVAVSPEGSLSFAVRGDGEGLASYFAARRAVAHALLGASQSPSTTTSEDADEADRPTIGRSPEAEISEEDPLVSHLKQNGWAVPCARTLDDIDGEVLARIYRLSEEGVAHLFAEASGIVVAMAGSTKEDRRRAAEKLPALPARSYSSRGHSVLFDRGEAGGHYSEEPTFGHVFKEAPKPKAHLLEEAAKRFKAARFVRPSTERPLDAEAIRRRVRREPLVRAAVRLALAADVTDAGETLRRVVAAVLIARCFSRKIVRRALAAERPWDSEAERERTAKNGRRIRSEIVAAREACRDEPLMIRSARELDAARREDAGARWTDDPELRRVIERRRKSGRSAYDTARAVYLQRCPELARKLLHLLRREGGAVREREFVFRHAKLAGAGTVEPEAALRAALRSLAEAGKVRRVRSSKTGEVFLAATEPLDETGFRRSLNRLIRDERFGIVSPWVETSGVEPEGGEDEEALLGHDPQEVFPEETGHGASLERIADEGAREEIEVLTA
jgi:hypothetical protein